MRVHHFFYILLGLVTVLCLPFPAAAGDIDGKLSAILADFEPHFLPPAAGKNRFIAVRSFMDKATNRTDSLSEEISDRFSNLIVSRYLARKKIVIVSWKSTTSLRTESSPAADIRSYRNGVWLKRLKEIYGEGVLLTGTTTVNDGHAVVTAELIHIPSAKRLISAIETVALASTQMAVLIKTEKRRTEAPAKKKIVSPGRIFIVPQPADARIRFVDRQDPFHQGIALKPGTYRLEISAEGFAAKNQTVAVESGKDIRLSVSLVPLAVPSNLKYQVIEGKDFKYEGYILDGLKQGTGTYHFPGGAIYTGEWHNDRMHGKGTYVFAGGDRYEGEWLDGKMNGKGTYRYRNGDRYEGHWKMGKRNGPGVHYFKAGDKWKGAYRDDKKHGDAVYTWSDGKSKREAWQNGQLSP